MDRPHLIRFFHALQLPGRVLSLHGVELAGRAAEVRRNLQHGLEFGKCPANHSIKAAFRLMKTPVNADVLPAHMTALRKVGVPYTDAEIAASSAEVKGKTEMEAVVAYLQVLGTTVK